MPENIENILNWKVLGLDQIEKLVSILGNYNNAQDKVASISIKTNEINELLAISIKKLNEQGQELVETFKNVRDIEGNLTDEFSRTSVAIKNQADATERLISVEEKARQQYLEFQVSTQLAETETERINNEATASRILNTERVLEAQERLIQKRFEEAQAERTSGSYSEFHQEMIQREIQLSKEKIAVGIAEIDVTQKRLSAQQKLYNSLAAQNQRQQETIQRTREAREAQRELAEQANNTGNSVTLSWTSIARILQAQALHILVYKVVNALKEGTRAAIDFEIKVGEIRTIAQDANQTFTELAGSLLEVSNQLNRPVKDVTEGYYQILSNQVTKAGQSLLFLQKAGDFARIGNISLTDSVNLLASAQNSYGLSLDDVDKVAQSFFKSIEIGRIRGNDLANTLGRVTSLASPLGVSLQEVEAAITAMTIKGIPANEAYTLINNVLLRLLKPSKEMSELFKEMGVSSGKAAIAANGFGGTLQLIQEKAKNDSSEMAQLFTNIRALRGELTLGGDAFEKYNSNLAQILDPKAAQDYTDRLQKGIQNSGYEIQKGLNEIKNYFIGDFGESLLDTLNSLIGGSQGMVKTAHELVTVLGTLGRAALIYLTVGKLGTAFYTATTSATALNAVLGTMIGLYAEDSSAALFAAAATEAFIVASGPIILIGAAIGGLAYYWEKSSEAASEAAHYHESAAAKISKSVNEATKNEIRNLKEQEEAFNTTLDNEVKKYQKYAEEALKLSDRIYQNDIKNAKNATNNANIVFDLLIKKSESQISKLTSDANKLEEINRRLKDNVEKVKDDLQTKGFEHDLKLLPAPEKVDFINKKIVEMHNNAVKAAQAVPKTVEEAAANANKFTRNLEESDKLRNKLADERAVAEKKREEIAGRINELQTEQAANSKVNDLRHEIDIISSREVQLRQAHSKVNDEELKSLQLQKVALREKLDLETANNTDEKKQREIELLETQLKTLDAQLTKLPDLLKLEQDRAAAEQEQVRLSQLLLDHNEALAKLAQKQAEQKKLDLEILRQTVKEINALKLPKDVNTSTVKGFSDDFDSKIKAAIASGALADPGAIIAIQNEKDAKIRALEDELQEKKVKALQDELISKKEELKKAESDKTGATSEVSTGKKTDVETIGKLIVELEKEAKVRHLGKAGSDELEHPSLGNDKVIEGIKNAFKEFKNDPSIQTETALRKSFEQVRDFEVNKDRRSFDIKSDAVRSAVDYLDQLEKEKSIPKTAKHMADLDAQIKQLEKNLQRTNAELNKYVNDHSIPETPKHFARGGPVGGDTVPAWLDPREFVMSPEATSRFYPELVKMNSGYQTQYNSKTSSSQINFGDINLTYHGSGHTQADAIAIGKAIHREIRRGLVPHLGNSEQF